MYHAIGGDMSVRESAIIGIFDLDNTSYGKHTRNFLSTAEKNGQVLSVTDELPKSFLLTEEFGMERVILTQFHAATLEKRITEQK